MFMLLWEQLLNSIFLLYTFPFVLSAELRPCWFICSRKEEPLQKWAFPCNLSQINVENYPEVAAGDIDGIMTSDSYINVSTQYILI